MKLLTIFILFLALSGQACEYKLEFTSDYNAEGVSKISKVIEELLANKGYIKGNGDLKVHLKSSLTTDSEDPSLFVIRSTIKLNKFNVLANFTHGYGSPSKTKKQSLALKELKKSIAQAISHLPFCI